MFLAGPSVDEIDGPFVPQHTPQHNHDNDSNQVNSLPSQYGVKTFAKGANTMATAPQIADAAQELLVNGTAVTTSAMGTNTVTLFQCQYN